MASRHARCCPSPCAPAARARRAGRASDRATIFEAVRCAFETVAAEGPVIVILDDLQWSDEATLELLAALAPMLGDLPVLAIAAYRSDGLPRDHMLRWLRNELRRGGGLDELVLSPLDRAETAQMLTELLPGPPSPALVRALHDRTQGVPFFVDELARALLASGRLQRGTHGFELGGDGEVPVPDTVRDAVLMGASQLSEQAREAAEGAAVAGQSFDLQLVAELTSEAGLAELMQPRPDSRGRRRARLLSPRLELGGALLRRALATPPGVSISGSRKRSRRAASRTRRSPRTGSGPASPGRAREAPRDAARESEAVHAYRDATSAGRQALELWPDDEDADARSEVLERYARCAELAGQLSEAIKGWRELAAIRSARGESLPSRKPSGGSQPSTSWAGSESPRLLPAPIAVQALLRERQAGRRRHRALRDGQSPADRRQVQRRARAGTDGRRRCHRGRAPGPARASARARGRGAREAGRLRGGPRDRPQRPRTGARARLHRGRRGALSAARHGSLRLCRLPPRRGGPRCRARALPDRRRRRDRGRLRDLPRVRAARARRVGAGRRDQSRADRSRQCRRGWRKGCWG